MESSEFFRQITEALQRYSLVLKPIKNGIIINTGCKNGFDIALEYRNQEYKLTFDGWQKQCDDPDEITEILIRGITGTARIKKYCNRGHPFKWMLQLYDDGQWKDQFTNIILTIDFGSKTKFRYLINDCLK